MSELKVNSIVDASSGNTVQINGQTPSESNMQGRNRIINGNMRIDQRNAGAAVTIVNDTNQYTVDRWQVVEDSSCVLSAQQLTDSPATFQNSFRLTVTTAAGSVGASELGVVEHRIEGFNTADLAFGTASAATVTLSFWVKSSITGMFGGSLRNNGNNRSYPFSYTINAANTWEQKTVTIPGDTTGTWVTNNGIGIRLIFDIGSGSSRRGTAGAWVADNLFGVTGAASIVTTLNATWQVTGVQLEAGAVATPFERRPFGAELALCQRYACSTFQQGVAWGQNKGQPGLYVLTQSTSARVSATFKFPVSMRATPTIVSYNPIRADSGFENLSTDANVAATISGITDGLTTEQAVVRTTSAASAVNNALVIHLSASAEL